MRFFLAGIMQGSRRDVALHGQDYRPWLRELIETHFDDASVYDPLADHQGSLDYGDERGRQVFYQHNRLCREVDVIIAFVPEASMGTAIEMWEAHEHGRGVVIAISPLAHNWAVRFCSHAVYPDLESFAAAVRRGEVAGVIARGSTGNRS